MEKELQSFVGAMSEQVNKWHHMKGAPLLRHHRHALLMYTKGWLDRWYFRGSASPSPTRQWRDQQRNWMVNIRLSPWSHDPHAWLCSRLLTCVWWNPCLGFTSQPEVWACSSAAHYCMFVLNMPSLVHMAAISDQRIYYQHLKIRWGQGRVISSCWFPLKLQASDQWSWRFQQRRTFTSNDQTVLQKFQSSPAVVPAWWSWNDFSE